MYKLELECEYENVKLKYIINLFDLYLQAIEFYTLQNNNKSKIFQHKLKRLLNRNNI